MNPSGLREFLGSDYEVKPLKSRGLLLRNALKPWLIRQPPRGMAYLIEAGDGRRFKLVRFPRPARERCAAIAERLRVLADHPAVPALVWSDRAHLLCEWIEGYEPSVDDEGFARRLGAAFAALYRFGYEEQSRETVLEPFLGFARELAAAGGLEAALASRFESRLLESLPSRIPTSILCSDQNVANFRVRDDGHMYMIDPGAFQSRQPVDLFLVGDGLYDEIRKDAFHEEYGRAGGIEFPFAHLDALGLMHGVRYAALQVRLLQRTSFLERRRRRSLTRRIEGILESLRHRLA